MPYDVVDSVVEHGGLELAVRDFRGDGPDVLLLHGMGGNLEHWSVVAPLLRERFRLVAMDLPGHGRSSVPARYDLDADVAAATAVQRALGLVRPAVVGHSYGGMVAVAMGSAQPDDHPVVVNVDGVGFSHAGTPPELQEEWRRHDEDHAPGPGDDRWLEGQIASDEREMAGDGITDVPAGVVQRSYQQGSDGLWRGMPPGDYGEQVLAGIREVDLLARYTTTRCRTVTVLTRRDGTTDRERWMLQHVQVIRDVLAGLATPGGETAEVGSRHMVPLEAPAELAELLDRVLR